MRNLEDHDQWMVDSSLFPNLIISWALKLLSTQIVNFWNKSGE